MMEYREIRTANDCHTAVVFTVRGESKTRFLVEGAWIASTIPGEVQGFELKARDDMSLYIRRQVLVNPEMTVAEQEELQGQILNQMEECFGLPIGSCLTSAYFMGMATESWDTFMPFPDRDFLAKALARK